MVRRGLRRRGNPVARGQFRGNVQTFRFRKLVHVPLPFVFRWCTDYREDDDRLTDSIYHYRAQILLREPARVVRLITVPGRDRNRSIDVEVITLRPPDRWRLDKMSISDDETGSYRLTRHGRMVTSIDMRFRKEWKAGRVPDRKRHRALFNRVWDRYVEFIEADYRRHLDR